MSEHDNNEHSSFIKTPKQLIAVIVLAFVVPIGIISMLASLAMKGAEPGTNAASEEAVAKRLKPVGEVVVSNEPAPPPEAAAAPVVVAAATPGVPAGAPAAGGAGDAAKGKSVYDTACMACHGTGAAGAPKLGDKAAWAPRMKQGMPALYDAAMKGKGAMPPKGGNMALPDADVKAAVDFLASQAK
ncbi:MAG TPA: c-type cytochrome [Burkholderiales bacterium]|nr:c-type cytochrome [Burkholderiales bacterium]